MLRPDGGPGVYGVVSFKVATAVVAMTDDDAVVLVGQWRYPLGRWSWELVEGGVDDGETVREAAARELAEEAGLVAHTWQHLLGPVALSNSVTSEEGHLWLATDLGDVTTSVPADPTEDLLVAAVPFDQTVAMVADGRIDDALSVMGILAAARLRTTT